MEGLAEEETLTGHPHLTVPKSTAMVLPPSLGHGFPSEPLIHPLGAPGEQDMAGCTVCPVPGEDTSRSEQAQASLGPPEHITGELKDTEPATSPARLPLASSRGHQDGGKRCEVLEKANLLDRDLEIEGDSDGPAPGGIWGPWAPSTLPTPAELEWDPAGDVGGLGPSGQKISRIPGAPCELCGYRGPQGSGQGLEDKKRQASPSPPDVMLEMDHGANKGKNGRKTRVREREKEQVAAFGTLSAKWLGTLGNRVQHLPHLPMFTEHSSSLSGPQMYTVYSSSLWDSQMYTVYSSSLSGPQIYTEHSSSLSESQMFTEHSSSLSGPQMFTEHSSSLSEPQMFTVYSSSLSEPQMFTVYSSSLSEPQMFTEHSSSL
ncbi:hypothetical protein STEG23_027289 [Scotinomys teguina]